MRMNLTKFFYCLTAFFVVALSNSASNQAHANISMRVKSQPDVYQFSPAPLPQIPMGVFYQLHYTNTVDPETSFLNIEQQDFLLPSRDGINLPITRYYDSGRTNSGISGQGWRWGFESQVHQSSSDTLTLIGFDGRAVDFTSIGDFQFASYEQGELLITRSTSGYQLEIGKSIVSYDAGGKLKGVEGANGGQIDYLYENDKLVAVDLFGRAKVSLEYSDTGLLSSIELPTGKQISYQYENGLLVKATDPAGAYVEYAYTDKLLSGLTYQGKHQVGFEYSTEQAGKITKVVMPNGSEIDYEFSEITGDDGTVKSRFTVSQLGRTESYEISPKEWTITRADGSQSVLEFDEKFSRLLKKQEFPGDRSVNFSYDSIGRIQSVSDSSGKQTDYEYDGKNLVNVYLPRGTQVSLSYDEKGNVKNIVDQSGDKTEFTYSALGQVASIRNPSGQVSRYKYYKDSGLLSEMIDPSGSKRELTYDDQYRLRSEWINDERALLYRYNDKQRILKIARSGADNKIWTKIAYNEFGRPLNVTSSNGSETDYQYNEMSQLISVQEPGSGAHQFSYDEFGSVKQLQTANGEKHGYEYDVLGRLTKLTNPHSESLTYEYDQSGRLVSEQVTGREPVKYSYDSASRLSAIEYAENDRSSFEYNLDDELISAERNGSQTVFARDAKSQPLLVNLQKKHVIDGKSITNDYQVEWYKDGAVKSILYPSGMLAKYAYNDAGRLHRVDLTDASTGEVKEIVLEYLDEQIVVSYPNGVTGTHSGFNDGEQDYLQSIEVTKTSGEQLARFEYSYDLNGNLVASGTQQGNEKKDARVQVFAYDEKSQLIGFSDSLAKAAQVYKHDADYNRTKLVDADSSEKSEYAYEYDKGRLTSDGLNKYQYDAQGNVISKTSIDGRETRYEYTARNELVRVIEATDSGEQVTQYQYDALGNRAERIVNGETTYSDFLLGHRLAETNNEERREFVYLPGLDQVVAQQRVKGDKSETYFYHRDRSNSVVLLTDEKGDAVNRYTYNPFGEKVFSEEKVQNNFAYTGRYLETSTNLYDYRTRFYQPSIGRFTTEDRYLAFAGVPASYNRYTYVFNNPNRYRDPNGEFINVIAGAVGAGIGAVVGGGIQVVSNVASGNDWNHDLGRAVARGAVVGGVGGLTMGASIAVGGVAGVGIMAVSTAGAGTAFDAGHDRFFGDGFRPLNEYATEFVIGTAINAATGYALSHVRIAPSTQPGYPNLGVAKPHWVTGGVGNFVQRLPREVASFARHAFQPSLTNTHRILGDMSIDYAVDVAGYVLGSAISEAIFEDGADEDGADEDGADEDGADEDGADEDGADEDGADEDGADEDGADEDGADEDGADEDGADEDGADEDGADEDGADEDGADEDGADEDGADEDGADEDGADEDGADEDGADEDGADEDGADEDGADEDGADEDGADEDAADEDAADEDAADEDAADEDAADEDAADEDAADEDAADEDAADEDAADEDGADEDAADEDAADEDAADEDAADEDAADEDAADEDAADEDAADEDAADEDAADEDGADEDAADEDAVDEDAADEDDNNALGCIQSAGGGCIRREAEDDSADDDENECGSADNCVKATRDRAKNCRETNSCAEIPPFVWKPG